MSFKARRGPRARLSSRRSGAPATSLPFSAAGPNSCSWRGTSWARPRHRRARGRLRLWRPGRQVEACSTALQQYIEGLNSSKAGLHAQMGQMVPLADLQRAQAETARQREAADGLAQQLKSAQAGAEKLKTSMEVSRARRGPTALGPHPPRAWAFRFKVE